MKKDRTHRHTAPVGPALLGSELADRDSAAAASNALVRRQLVYGQHGFADPARYAAACRVAELPA